MDKQDIAGLVGAIVVLAFFLPQVIMDWSFWMVPKLVALLWAAAMFATPAAVGIWDALRHPKGADPASPID